jgi:hypothetical protein
VQSLDTAPHGVVVIDSLTHLWEAAIAAYSGKKTSIDSIPMHAWGKIKKPYKDLMAFLLSSPLHVIICGRQGTEYATDEETRRCGGRRQDEGRGRDALRAAHPDPHGSRKSRSDERGGADHRLRREGPHGRVGRAQLHQPHVRQPVRSAAAAARRRAGEDGLGRRGRIEGRRAAGRPERQRGELSTKLLREWSAKVQLANDPKALKDVGKGITPQLKAQMLPSDVAQLREAYQTREAEIGKAVTA